MLVSTSVVTILAGILRQKMIALELGPSGVGSLGLLISLSTAIATLGGMGLPTSGVQRISMNDNSPLAIPTQQSLLWGSAVLGTIVGILTVILSPLLGVPSGGFERWVVAITVAFMIISSGQIALLNGLGKIRDIAWMNGLSAVISTTLTVATLLILPTWGLYTALLSPVLVLLVLGWWFRRRAVASLPLNSLNNLWKQLRAMLSLGIVFAAGTGISSLGQYIARWYLQNRFGEVNLGQYQAAWSITMIYLGVLLSAMSVEFFPRVSRVVAEQDFKRLNKVVSDQVKLLLVLSVPVICVVILFSEVVITLLYSAQFKLAAELARQQFLGDIFKLASWALSYTLLAGNAKFFIFLSELMWIIVYLLLLFVFAQFFGFSSIGWAYVGAYAIYLPFVAFLYWKHTRQHLSAANWLYIAIAILLVVVHILAEPSLVFSVILAVIDFAALTGAGVWFFNRRKRFGKQTV